MKSQELDVIDDRGTAKYFHGRKPEINFFKNSLEQSKKRSQAKSILIQGPPGVGKTALIMVFTKSLFLRCEHG
ncbi:MAG: ATP-binding protein [Flavobacteriaceae bacterium]|nr:ATP-binding protein [Flavobacteriaceae bacterium]MCY4267226.1 ATP-binding protein [Flavobacteriaceae bacterium]MCY4299262.1 ATP-binding protein [Flavobacteriaceae bacterium]